MKKQVLSFEEFVFEAFQVIQEAEETGASFDDVKQKLSDLIDQTGRIALAKMESHFTSNSNTKSGLLAFAAKNFDELIAKYDGKKIKIDSVDVYKDMFQYKNLIQGNVFLSKFSPIAGTEIPSGYTLAVTNKKTKLVDLLGAVNSANIAAKKMSQSITTRDGVKVIYPTQEGDREGIYSGTGLDRQYVLTDVGADGFEFNKNIKKSVLEMFVTPAGSGLQYDPDFAEKKVKKATLNNASFCLVFYTINNIVPGDGNPITVEKIEKVITIVKGGDEQLAVNISDNGTLFDQGKSVLKDDGKLNITNAIANQFSAVSKIEVIGGASKEGPDDLNKKLCLDRAKAVAEYLKTVCKGAEITASNETNIQPEASTDDLKTWRKVTLNITGTKLNKQPDVEKVDYVARVKNLKADRANINQVIFQFNVETTEA